MKDTTEQNKAVPNSVMMFDAVPSVENYADWISDAARDDERNRRETECVKQRLDGDYPNPAHYQIWQYGQDGKAFAEENFEHYPNESENPDKIKKALSDAFA